MVFICQIILKACAELNKPLMYLIRPDFTLLGKSTIWIYSRSQLTVTEAGAKIQMYSTARDGRAFLKVRGVSH